MLDNFIRAGKASFLMGGQWGSEGKGAAAAYLARHLLDVYNTQFDIVTTNAGAQAGHTSTDRGTKRIVYHLPTAALIGSERPGWQSPHVHLNAGSIIDPEGLMRELEQNPEIDESRFSIHPNAAVITPECRAAEMRDDSAQTKIASTRKGVGEALSRKVLRSGMIAKDHPVLRRFVSPYNLNVAMASGRSVLVEVPQGYSLSLNGPFYPHVTSRNCTVMQAMSDANIHPHFYHQSMLVLRTFPIRVGHIRVEEAVASAAPFVAPPDQLPKYLGQSGGCYEDQHEMTWEELGQTPEITTVTKRVRRVFSFSEQQVIDAIRATRPTVIYLTFCDYVGDEAAVMKCVRRLSDLSCAHGIKSPPLILTQWGPTTQDVRMMARMQP